MVRNDNKIILVLSFFLYGILISCHTISLSDTILLNLEQTEIIKFEIENTSLFYSWTAEIGLEPQIVKFQLINMSNQTYVIPFRDDLFFMYDNIEMYYNDKDYYIEEYLTCPLLRIFDKNDNVVPMGLGGSFGQTEIIKADSTLIDTDKKFIENIIVLKPYEKKLIEMEIALPIHYVGDLVSRNDVRLHTFFVYQIFEKDGYTADLFMIVDSTWIKKIPEEKIAEFEKNNIKMFTGTISSNRIPVLLKDSPVSSPEQKETKVDRKNDNK